MIPEKLIQELKAIAGPEQVLTAAEDRWTYAFDATDLDHMPDAVVFPGSAAEISRILVLANAHRFPVVPRGAGTGRSGGAVPIQGGVVLVLTRLNRILEINTKDLVAVVEPGVILGRLKAAVEEKGLYYPPDPASAEFCTIGGNVAECAGGAVAVQYGVTRDYVLGLEVVLPTGEIIEAGTRTMKGVVGYDLTRLFLGSEGTLGVITRITLRLVAKPVARQTLAAAFKTLQAAGEAVSLILASGLAPTALEFLDQVTLGCVREMLPFKVPAGAGALLLIAVDGHPRDVEERAARIARFCEEQCARPVLRAKTPAEAEELWKARKVVSPSLKKVKPQKVSEDVVVPLGAIPELIAALAKISRRRGLIIPCYGHAGDGNIHVNILYDRNLAAEREAVGATVEDIFVLVRRLQGTLSGEHGIGLTKAPYLGLELSPGAIALQKRLKAAFDPNNIMNPGKVFPAT
ncbi:MAG: FAD-linked oxidase C-terminal domain-containing protein [Syntrophales bacterium]|nr:FAD-linked oxidase C-terminal domain-containing protein [Syntrophales bacterium]MDD5640900.1 FAD-linked oxidase C-terminal domain-containing protein [Syntrophales bacterium]